MTTKTLRTLATLLTVGSAVGTNAPGPEPPGRQASQIPRVQLTEPEPVLSTPFSLIQGLRELPDGRVLVADPLEQVVLIADPDRGTADTLGGVGQGPGEYRQPDGLYPLPGDSTLLVDLGNARLTVIGPDGRFGATAPVAQGTPGPRGAVRIVLPAGTDAHGGIYYQPFGGGRPGMAPPDSAPVLRWDRATGSIDTLTRVKRAEVATSSSGGGGGQQVRMMPVPLSPEDAWAVARDGRVAVARVGDYHVEWIDRDGRVVAGEPVPFEAVPIRRADKEEWLEGLANGLRVGVTVENGRRRMSFGRGGRGGGPDPDRFDWPKNKPPFVADGVRVSPDGEAWVERHVPAAQAPLFDVFDADGARVRQVVLPRGRELIGFGRDAVYAVRVDEMGLQWLERYRS